MRLLTTTRLALNRILSHKTRSGLTMLGVIIGVASLVALTSIASGATSGINSSLSDLGARQITVSATTATGLTEDDADALKQIDGVQVVSSSVSGTGAAAYRDSSTDLNLTGVSRTYTQTNQPDIAVGDFLPAFDGAEDTRTVVLSAQAANDLQIQADDMGHRITIDGRPFTVVGVLDDANGFGSTGTAYVSMTNARKLFAQAPYVNSITVQAASEGSVDTVEAQVDDLLRSRYHLDASDSTNYSTTNQASLLSTIDDVQATLQLLLAGIASISLVVGGIGIMNIMLVSVRERVREIGVRRAVGARQRHILWQFLIEAIVLAILGGLIGLAVGLGISAAVAAVAGWTFAIQPGTVALAVGFSALVGVVFGVWPARTAARLQPVEALRFD